MAKKVIRSLFHFESKGFHVEFFKVVEKRKEWMDVWVTSAETGGFENRRSFTIDTGRDGTIAVDNTFGDRRGTIFNIPVLDKTGTKFNLSMRFVTSPEKGNSFVSIGVVGFGGGDDDEYLVGRAKIVNDEKLIEIVSNFIENNIPICWNRGVYMESDDREDREDRDEDSVGDPVREDPALLCYRKLISDFVEIYEEYVNGNSDALLRDVTDEDLHSLAEEVISAIEHKVHNETDKKILKKFIKIVAGVAGEE